MSGTTLTSALTPALQAALASTVTSLALCWRIERRDGAVLGFTTHDADVTTDGLTYWATPGMSPSATGSDSGLDGGDMDIGGSVTAGAISAMELRMGRYEGSRAELLLLDWQAPEHGALLIAAGAIEEVNETLPGFNARLHTPVAALDTPVLEVLSPECRARLGDARCRVDLAGRAARAKVTSSPDPWTATLLSPVEPGIYAFGRLRLLDGAHAGVDIAVLGNDASTLMLADPVPDGIAWPACVLLHEGCDRRLATCRDRFANARNFRGEPFVPGNDEVGRYPGL